MNLSHTQRHALEVYAASDRVTLEDVKRECAFTSIEAASECVRELASMGLLRGDKLRKITEEGQAVLEGRDVPVMTPPPASENLPATADSEDERRKMLSDILAERHKIDVGMLRTIIVSSVIGKDKDGNNPTAAEVFHVMSVMEQYRLDPWMKQLHAFRHKGKLNVMVGYDGWVKIAKREPTYLGAEYEYSDKMVESPDGKGKKSWEWIKVKIHSKGRIPTEVYCYFDEWYVPMSKKDWAQPGPWQNQTKWRHRQKAFTLAVREHFGISLYDETDREQIMYHQATYSEVDNMAEATVAKSSEMAKQLAAANEDKDETPEELGSINPADLVPADEADEWGDHDRAEIADQQQQAEAEREAEKNAEDEELPF